MTRKDCEQHGLQYFDLRPKKGGKEEVARTLTGQPLLENLNSEPESAMRGVILQSAWNYLVLFGITLIPRMVLQRGVMRELVSQAWRISQVSLPNLSIFLVYHVHST